MSGRIVIESTSTLYVLETPRLALAQRLLYGRGMKLIALASLSLLALVDMQTAEACSPAPTCADDFCRGETTALVATLQSTTNIETYEATVTIQIATVHGNAAGISAGTTGTFKATPYGVSQADIGKQLVFYASTDAVSGELQVQWALDPATARASECFGASSTAATIADAAVSPSCEAAIVAPAPPPPSCPDGVGCSATGSSSSALLGLGLLGLVVRRRRAR